MSELINATSTLYAVVQGMTTDITGNIVLTFLFFLLLTISFSVALRIPMEWGIIFTIPLAIALMAFNGAFLAVGGALLLLIALIIAKNYFIQ